MLCKYSMHCININVQEFNLQFGALTQTSKLNAHKHTDRLTIKTVTCVAANCT